jgi:hypothetical protein
VEDADTGRINEARASSRLVTQPNRNMNVNERAQARATSRNLEGTNLNPHKSFSLLDNDDIIASALEIGIDASSLSYEKNDFLKDLEVARHNLELKEKRY